MRLRCGLAMTVAVAAAFVAGCTDANGGGTRGFTGPVARGAERDFYECLGGATDCAATLSRKEKPLCK